MADDDDALGALRKHNEQLQRLLSGDGPEQIERMILLELALHAYTYRKLSSYAEKLDNDEVEIKRFFGSELQKIIEGNTDQISNDIITFLKSPDWAKTLGKKVGSVANAYVKKTAGGIIGGDDTD